MEEKIAELKNELVKKDEHILKLEKINHETQKKMSDLQKRVIEFESKAEGIDLSPASIEQTREIEKLKLKLKRREEILKDIKKKMDVIKKKYAQKPDQKQLEVMRSAINKIKSVQSELKLKNSKILELREHIEKLNLEVTSELDKKDEIIKNRNQEIEKLENEFVSFKEEFLQELDTLEKQKETISVKNLMDSKKDLEIEKNKFQEIIAEKDELIEKYQDDIKSFKLMLESRDKKIDELEGKVDNLLLDDESTKTLQSKIQSIEDEFKEKLRIRVQELEKTREEIILITSELTCAVPDLSAEEILECVDDIMLVSPNQRYEKIKEIKLAKTQEGNDPSSQNISEQREEDLDSTENLVDDMIDEITEIPIEGQTEEIVKEVPSEQKIAPTPTKDEEDLKLRELIDNEIPNLADVEKETLMKELMETEPEGRRSKIELLKMTKELESLKKDSK